MLSINILPNEENRNVLLVFAVMQSNNKFIVYIIVYFGWLRTEWPGFGFRQRQRIFPLPCAPIRPWGPPSFFAMVTRGSFPGDKVRPGRDADHSPSPCAEVKKEQELTSCTHPEAPFMACCVQLYFYYCLVTVQIIYFGCPEFILVFKNGE
jgi:hypothetical protein